MRSKTLFSMQFLTVAFVLSFLLSFTNSCAQEKEREVSTTSFTFQVNNKAVKLNHFSSPAVDQKNKKITRLVIVVHGTTRNPYTYHKNMRIAAEKAGASENTLIISPGFIMERDLNENKDLLTDDHIFWTNSGWKQGDASVSNSKQNIRNEQMSSFEVMDSIIWQVLKSGNFPNIKHIVVSGNSAGGQYVNRYIGGNLIHEAVKKKFGIEIKYLVAAPSSYTYFSTERPVIGSLGKYFIPADTSCGSSFNKYRHGMDSLNAYMSITGPEKIIVQYGKRKVAYFVGAQDNDPAASDLDKSCAAMLMGRERSERAQLYVEYLFHYFGKRSSLTIVDDSGHDHAKMFASENGMKWLFRNH